MAKKTKMTTPKTGRKGDKELQASPDTSKDRGDGSAFALAMDAAQQKKDSFKDKAGYLGVPVETLDPKEFV